MTDQRAETIWREGTVPVSARFDDPYFSLENGLEEARHVFLSGNDLPARFRDGFQISELGFGTGLNFLATAEAWIASGTSGMLRFTSFEAFPVTTDDMRRALSAFPDLARLSRELCDFWTSGRRESEILTGIHLTVVEGDARETVPLWHGSADAWYLDGFSPAKNPELWTAGLMSAVAHHTRAKGTFATYSAAGHVRRALGDAGFAVERRIGYGRKRHMTVGRLTK